MCSISGQSSLSAMHIRTVLRLIDLFSFNMYTQLLRASEGTLSRWSRLHLQSLAPTNPYWASVVGYSPFSLWLIHKEGLCPNSGDINRLMMMYLQVKPGGLGSRASGGDFGV
jgi:hypothetical protein